MPDETQTESAPNDAAVPAGDDDRGWQRLRRAITMRPGRDQWVIAVLCALLGFGIVLQVRTTNADTTLATARPDDLVRLLDSLDQRSDRLDAEIAELQQTRERLAGSRDKEAAAEAERAQREQELGVLAGTVPAEGPGVEIRFDGPVNAVLLLDTVQELRDAGAEAQQVGNQQDGAVRIVASTSFVEGPSAGSVIVDGTTLTAPFVLKAIGAPATLTSALRIPGGISDAAAADDVQLEIAARTDVLIDAVRVLPTTAVAEPS
jgi:uncharacterized protein YlxW (UPF0749 family)